MIENKKYKHIQLGKGDVGRYVLLPGDPFRTDRIASFFDEPKLVAHNREHKTWTGKLDGVPVAVTSTGMGGPSAAIAAEELIRCGADTLIRVGTAGAVRSDEDYDRYAGVIVTGSVRGCRAGAIMNWGDMDKTIQIACEARRRLIAADRETK